MEEYSKKSLIYVSGLYGNQVDKKESHKDVKKIVSFNFIISKIIDYNDLVKV